jgi:hypothetical protein
MMLIAMSTCWFHFAQRESQVGFLHSHFHQEIRHVVSQDRGRSRDPQMPTLFPLQFRLHIIEPREKGIEKIIEFLPGRGERKGPPIEEFHTQFSLQLQDLATHRGLLNSVRHFPYRRRNPFIFGDIVEQLKMVNVHFA